MLAIEDLEPVERPEPRPAEGEVLVRNRFLGVPGGEGAGEVVAAADPALVGRPVAYFPGHGYAEYAAVALERLVVLEPDTPLDVAAALALDGPAAYVLTHMAIRLGPGDRVVADGAIAQLARVAGATLVTGGATVAYGGGLEQLAPRGTLVLHGEPGSSLIDVAALAEHSLAVRWVNPVHYLETPAARAAAFRFALDRVRPEIADRVPLREAAKAFERDDAGKLLLAA